MIETVIAIVVMGIAVSALPLILTQSQNNNALSLQQEAIMGTKAKVAYILSYEWDARSYDVSAGVSRVLETNSTTQDSSTHFDTNNTRRKGHVEADKRRRLHSDKNTSIIADNRVANAPSDIDDFNYEPDENVSIVAQDDYIFSITLNPSVSYFDDGKMDAINYDANETTFVFDINRTKTSPTNIKMITVTTTGANGINITLRAFVSNIGESGILSKVNW
jgi:Tfp pilus assembly protein PilV